MPRVTEAGKEIIRKKGEYYAKHPPKVVSQRQIQKDLIDYEGIQADRATIRKCLQEGVKRAVGLAKFDQVYEQLWQKREIKPEMQELIRQMGADFAIHPDHVQPIRKIQRDLKSQKKRISLNTLRYELRMGVARVVKSPSQIKTTCRQLWRKNETPPEVQEIIRQTGEYYARHPEEAKTIKQIKQDLADQNYNVRPHIIRRHLREGAIRALGPEEGPKMVHNLWPRTETPPKIQEDIRCRGEKYARKLKESQENNTKLKPPPQIRQINHHYKKKGIILTDKTVAKFLKQGARRVFGPEKIKETFYQLWPKSKAPSEILEDLRQKGEYYAQHPEEAPSIYKIRQDLRDQGKHVDYGTISTQLWEGVRRVVGPVQATPRYQEIWPQKPHQPPAVREAIMQKGENYAKHPEKVKSLGKIQKDLAKEKIIVGILTIRFYLQKGVGRAVGHEKMAETYKSLWPISDTPFEVQQRFRQIGESLAIQFTNPNSEHFLDPDFIPSINKICKDLEKEGIYLSSNNAAPYLKEGVGRVVAPEQLPDFYSRMWPSEISPELQERIGHIFINDVKKMENGDNTSVRPAFYWQKELGVRTETFQRYGKKILLKEFGNEKGTELYEQRNALLAGDSLVGIPTHVICEHLFKEAAKSQGIAWYNEVKLPVPDPKLAKEYVKVDGVITLTPDQAMKFFNQRTSTGKTVAEELGVDPAKIPAIREVMVDFTQTHKPESQQVKLDKYAVDKDGKVIPDRVFLIVDLGRITDGSRVRPAPEKYENARIVKVAFAAEVFHLDAKAREILDKTLLNSERHDLVAQKALQQQLGYEMVSDSDAYWMAKAGHVPDLRYWQDLTEYFPAVKESVEKTTTDAKMIENGEKEGERNSAPQPLPDKPREAAEPVESQTTLTAMPRTSENKILTETPPNESNPLLEETINQDTASGQHPVKPPSPDQQHTKDAVVPPPPEQLHRGDTSRHDAPTREYLGGNKGEQQPNKYDETPHPRKQGDTNPSDTPEKGATLERNAGDKKKGEMKVEMGRTITLDQRPGNPEGKNGNLPPPTPDSWKKYWQLKDGVLWDPAYPGAMPPAMPPPEFLEPKKKYREKIKLTDLFPPGPEPPDHQEEDLPPSKFHPHPSPPPTKPVPEKPGQPAPEKPDQPSPDNPDQPMPPKPDNPFGDKEINAENLQPESDDPFPKGEEDKALPPGENTDDPFSDPHENGPTAGSGTWDDPNVFPPEGSPEPVEDDGNPFQEDGEEALEPHDDADPFFEPDPATEEDGQTPENGGDDVPEDDPASDDATEGEENEPTDDPGGGESQESNGDDGGNEGGGE